MSRIIPVGTLVRVLPEALQPNGRFFNLNTEQTTEHGWLYFVESNNGVDPDNPEVSDPYRCRSLATGEEGMQWLPQEVEEAPTDD